MQTFYWITRTFLRYACEDWPVSDSTSTSPSSASSAAPFGELQNLKLSGKGYSFDDPDPAILELQQRVEAIEARHLREDEEEAWSIGTIGVKNKCSFLRMAGVSEEKIAEYERRHRVRI
jgi:hypothetical protein